MTELRSANTLAGLSIIWLSPLKMELSPNKSFVTSQVISSSSMNPTTLKAPGRGMVLGQVQVTATPGWSRLSWIVKQCLSRGMGKGAYDNLQEFGIRPVVTEIALIEEAVLAYANQTIVDRSDLLH